MAPATPATAPYAVVRHESELGSWEMVRREAPPRLRGAVARSVGYSERWRGPLSRRETPECGVVLVLGLGPDLAVGRAGAQPERHTALVAGLHERPVRTEHGGEQTGVQVDLSPLAARAILGVPLREVANRTVELHDLLGTEGSELVDRMRELTSWGDRFAVLDSFLERRLAAAAPPRPEVTRAFSLLAASHGRLPVEALASETGFSRRHLTARFHEEIGLPPKSLARILRFGRARTLLLEGGHSLADVAFECGYYDQPHLNRDFRELAGVSPLAYLGARLPDGGGISADDLPFVQDAGSKAA
jgi:AraC-like DNA-binding protein